MNVILRNLMINEKAEKRDKDNKIVFELLCFQRGYKNLVTIKDVPQDLFNELQELTLINIESKMTVWSNNNSFGASFRFINLVA